MKNQLTHFESFIEQFLLDHHKTSTFSAERYHQVMLTVSAEKAHLKNALDDLLFSDCDDQYIFRSLRIYQQRLIAQSNHVYRHMGDLLWGTLKVEPKNNSIEHIYLQTAMFIDELLQSATIFRKDYFDPQINIANYNLDLQGISMQKCFEGYIRRLKKYKVPITIIDVLREFFLEFDSRTGNSFTFHQMEYAAKLLRGVEKMMKREESAAWPQKIWQLLVYLNFNKERILQYSKQRIFEIAIVNKSYYDAHAALTLMLKELRPAEVNPNWAYEADHISLKTYNENQLEEELDYLQKHEEEQLIQLQGKDDRFFILDTTVKQLNLWAVLNVELKRIPHHSPLHVVKVVTSYIRTLNARAISYDSARKKLTDFDATTIKGLHDHLIQQVRLLESKFGHMLPVYFLVLRMVMLKGHMGCF
jgi:hypothetical protein